MENEKSFRDRFTELVKGSGKSQKQLSIESGVTEAAISRYLHGTRIPGMATLIMLKRTLGCPWEALMGE